MFPPMHSVQGGWVGAIGWQAAGSVHLERVQDQEGNVPHGGSIVQGPTGQTDDHIKEHQPQLCQVWMFLIN